MKWFFTRLNELLGLPSLDWFAFPLVLLIGVLYFGFGIAMMRVANRADRWIAKRSNYRNCPACGRRMQYAIRREVITYKGALVSHDSRGWFCTGCDEAVFDGTELLIQEQAVKAAIAGRSSSDDSA